MDALILGSGGWIPTAARETCCALVRDGERALLIDAGTGVRRLLEQRDLLEGVERVDVVLTHFHLDHVVGLSYLPALHPAPPPVVWAPGQLAYRTPSRSLLGRLIGRPYFGAPLDHVVDDVRELPSGSVEIGPFRLRVRVQERHAHPTVALRLGDEFTYCTDTAADSENASFASGSRVLLHEAWHASDTTSDAGHTAAGDAGRIATEAGVGSLVLIHVNPLLQADEELVRPAREAFPAAQVGRDLLRVA
jgi:ribonuclease BN (tRNA processing enzyme)